MRGKPATLATVGPRLTGPPEGYGKKKELQVKHWLTSAQPVAEVGTPDIAAEPSLYPSQSLDDVYNQLHDSTDRLPVFFGTPSAADGPAAEAGAEGPAAQLNTPVAAAALLPTPVVAITSTPAEATNLSAAEAQTHSVLNSSHNHSAGSQQHDISSPSSSTTQLAGKTKEAAATSVGVTEPSHIAHSGSNPPSAAGDAAATAIATFNPNSLQSSQQRLPLSAAAANLCQVLASAEAGKPVTVSNAELQQLQEQLLRVTREHQDYVTKTCAELAAAYAAAEATEAVAAADAAKSQQAVTALQQQVAAAEADAAAARSAGMQAQQEARQLRLEKEDVASEQLEQLQQMREQLGQVTQQNCQQNNEHFKVVQGLQQQLQDSKQHLLNSRRELELTRSHAAVQESGLMTQLQAVKGQTAQLQHQCSIQQQELEQLKQDLKQQQSARLTAEAAEAKALKLAAERAQLFETLLSEVQHSKQTAYRHLRTCKQDQHSKQAAGQQATSVDQQLCQQQGQPQNRDARSGSGPTASTGAASAAVEMAVADTTEARVKQRHSLSKGAATDKKVLAELAAARRRAEAAAQLQQSSKVQQMLNAAPEALKALGLAFRAYVLLPQGPQEATCNSARVVTQQLSCDYHMFLDQTTAADSNDQPSPPAESRCNPFSAALLGVCGAMIVILPPSDATVTPSFSSSSGSRGPSACSNLSSPGCLGLMLEAVRRGLPVMFLGQLAAAQKDQLLAAAAAGGWSQQELGTLAGYLQSLSCFSYSPQTAGDTPEPQGQAGSVLNLQLTLGLTDLQLSLLPQCTLKKLAASAAAGKSGVPDLLHLNCQTLTHLTLNCSAMTAAAQHALQQRQQQKQQECVGRQDSKLEIKAKQQQEQQLLDEKAEGIVTELVCLLLTGNRTLKVLKLEGVSSTAAEVIAAAAVGAKLPGTVSGSRWSSRCNDSHVCQLSLLGMNGMLVPVNALLAGADPVTADALVPHSNTTITSISSSSSSSMPGLQELDLVDGNLSINPHQTSSRPGSAKTAVISQQQRSKQVLLSEQQAVFLAVLLPHCSSLRSLQLPLLASDVSHEAAERLADAVLQLPQLMMFNGVHLERAEGVVSSNNSASMQLEQHQLPHVANSSKSSISCSREPEQQVVLDHAGQQLGVVGAALIARALQQSSSGALPSVINLAGCNIGSFGAASLAASLATLHMATHTPLATTDTSSSQSCRTKPEQLYSPSRHLATDSLHALQLSGNQLGPSGLRALLSALARSHSGSRGSLLEQLKVLDVSYNSLTSDGCQVLAGYCEKLKGLQVLNLTGNEISAAGAQALFGAFSRKSRLGSSNSIATTPGSSSSSRKNVDGSNRAVAGVGSCDVVPQPAVSSEQSSVLQKLRVLQLGCNVIGDAGLSALAAALPQLQQLQQLELQENYSIGVEGVRTLAAALSNTPILTHLNLAKNSIGPQGAKLLAAGLQANAAAAVAAAASEEAEVGKTTRFLGVRHLELEWCKMKTEGVAHIAAALVSTSTAGMNARNALKQGNTSSRAFSSSGGGGGGGSGGSGSAVAVHCCLEKLGLSRNGAGDKGVQALVEALATNSSLTHLDLRNNSIGLTGCRLLSGLLQGHNSSIRVLQLAGNMENGTDEEAPVLQALEELAAADRSSLRSA